MKVKMEIKKTNEGFKISVDRDTGRKPRIYRSYPTTVSSLILCIINAACEEFRYE